MSKQFLTDLTLLQDKCKAAEGKAFNEHGFVKRCAAFLGLEYGVYYNLCKTGLKGRHMAKFIAHTVEAYLEIDDLEFKDLYRKRLAKVDIHLSDEEDSVDDDEY